MRSTTYQDYGTTYISHPIPENNYLSGLWDDIYIPPHLWEQLPIRTMGRHIYPTPSLWTTTYQDYGTTYISHPISENNYLSGLWNDIYIPPHPWEQLPIRTMGRHTYPTQSLRITTYQDYGTTYISHPIHVNNYLSGLWDDIYIPPHPWEQLPIRTMGRHIYHTQSLRTTTYQDYRTTYISHPIPVNNYLSGLWDDIYIPPNPCEQLPIRTMGRHIYPTQSQCLMQLFTKATQTQTIKYINKTKYKNEITTRYTGIL
jgi:hypothetical protein